MNGVCASLNATPATGSPSDDRPLLAMRGITKQFPGVRALDNVDFALRGGEIHALMGENGAGKSTLIKVLTGVHRRDAGTITLAGQSIAPRAPLEAQGHGISTVYQEVNLIPYRSVAENIFLGREPRRWGCIRWRKIRRRAAALLAELDVQVDVTSPLNTCSIALQQMVAIARALDVQARVLILDEPTSSLDAAETRQLFAIMRRLREQGLGIVFITHFLDQVYEVSDRITVLRNGHLVGSYDSASLPRIELVSKMIGRSTSDVAALERSQRPPAAAKIEGPPFLRAAQLGRRHAVAPLDIEIRRGEVVGLAGLLGSGRTETARLLFGIDKADSGRIEVEGRSATPRSPRTAIANRLGFCPEDRKSDGIIPELSVRENIVLALQARRGWLRPLGARRRQQLAEQFIRTLRIATPDADKPVAQLSGGNQQKVILARWLAAEPRLLILDEPTRGIDVGAKAEIEKLIGRLCGEGMALLFISSEMEEMARNCHRVAVLRDRHKVGELAGAELTVPAMLGLIAAEHDHA